MLLESINARGDCVRGGEGGQGGRAHPLPPLTLPFPPRFHHSVAIPASLRPLWTVPPAPPCPPSL